MSDKLNQLMREARAAARTRGHSLGRFTRLVSKRTQARARCRHCSAYVDVNSAPLPNEIDIGGTAVAIGCTKS